MLMKSFSSLLGLKKGIFLGGTSTLAPGFGVSPGAPAPLAGAKASEAPDFDLIVRLQRRNNAFEDRFNDRFGFLPRASSVTRSTSPTRSAFVIVWSFFGLARRLPLPWDENLLKMDQDLYVN